MNRVMSFVLVCAVMTACSISAWATETGTMICSGGIVSLGDTMGQVTSKCGRPASANQREARTSRRVDGTKTWVSTTVEDWQYNFGPNEFQYSVLFENGRVSRIESLDYGY